MWKPSEIQKRRRFILHTFHLSPGWSGWILHLLLRIASRGTMLREQQLHWRVGRWTNELMSSFGWNKEAIIWWVASIVTWPFCLVWRTNNTLYVLCVCPWDFCQKETEAFEEKRFQSSINLIHVDLNFIYLNEIAHISN